MGDRSGGRATGPIDGVTAEPGSDAVSRTARHRLPSRHSEAVVTTDAPRASTTARRLAPLAVGAVVMLVATVVATLAQPPQDPSLAAQELSNTAASTDPAQAPPATQPPSTEPGPEPTAEPEAAAAPTSAPQQARKSETTERKKSTGGQASAGKGDGRSAAAAQGWTRVGGDEFNGGMSPLS